MARPLYVIGHRNPDTDSICAAIGYAHLKQALGEKAVAARAGKINAETRYVLERFGVEAPVLITDLYPRARDIMSPIAVTIHPDQTIRELGQLMRESSGKSAAVINEKGILLGIVSLGDLARRYFEELEMPDLASAGVTFQGLLAVLDGRIEVAGNMDRTVRGKIWIAAAKAETFRKLIGEGDIALAGDRDEAQLTLLECGIDALVLTGNARAGNALREAAASRGTMVFRTRYDTYTAARLINQSIPVRVVMQDQVVSFRPSDLVSDIRETTVRTRFRNYPVTENGRIIGMINRDRLIVLEREKVILVDHNEKTQAVAGIEEAHIIEIIDHHRLGGLETGEPIFIRHDPVGSTSTIVASMHWHRNVEMPQAIAGVLLAGILSDTLLFKSPTSTPQDVEMAERLALVAGVGVQEFGMAVVRAGSRFNGIEPEEIIRYDLKEFQISDYRVSISQISVMDAADMLANRWEELSGALSTVRQKEGYDLALLMVTDIMQETTHLLHAGRPVSLLRRAFGEESTDTTFVLPGTMSRKKQVVPPLVEAARAEELV
ncbi:MAG: putative signal transduction protein with domain containing protein [Firmicutes bacterium]|nr:putative signal transduction protein with domain containing protein [Bacillota bacterium]